MTSRIKLLASLAALLCLSLPPAGAQHMDPYRGPYYDDYTDEATEPGQPLPPTQLGPAARPYVPPPPPSQDPDVIEVPRLGWVRGNIGYKAVGGRRRPVSSFLGLPYGQLEDRQLGRFQPARAASYSRSGVFDATVKARHCPQYPELAELTQAEERRDNVDDCLTLDVYTTNVTGSLPVLVFVHGEMLFDGSSEEAQPEYLLAAGDVVLVSLNYRLAPFGFLTTLTDEMPGNVALADIQLALEWLQRHVAAFGGDPAHVTVAGQAGGSTLVHALSLSGKADGLYAQLVLQSGTALNPYLIDEDPLATVRSFARLARCPVAARDRQREAQMINSCFERLSTAELLSLFKRHWQENEPRGLRFTGGFKLAVGDRLGYLPQHPSALVANHSYPLIAGVAKDAGAFIMSRFYNQLAGLRSRNISDYIDVVLKHVAQPRHHALWRQWAIQHIFAENEIRNPSAAAVAQGLLELVNLILYRGPLVDSVRYTSARHPTFLYVFDYRGRFHRFDVNNPLPFEADATLSDDNIYLFPYPEEVSQLNAPDRRMAELISSMWVHFAAHGVPQMGETQWRPVSNEYGPFVRFTKNEPNPLELDYHFGEGIPVPNLYPQYFTTTTTPKPTTTTTTTTMAPRPYANNNYNYPSYPNYPGRSSQYQQQPQQQQYPRYPNYQSPSQYGRQY